MNGRGCGLSMPLLKAGRSKEASAFLAVQGGRTTVASVPARPALSNSSSHHSAVRETATAAIIETFAAVTTALTVFDVCNTYVGEAKHVAMVTDVHHRGDCNHGTCSSSLVHTKKALFREHPFRDRVFGCHVKFQGFFCPFEEISLMRAVTLRTFMTR